MPPSRNNKFFSPSSSSSTLIYLDGHLFYTHMKMTSILYIDILLLLRMEAAVFRNCASCLGTLFLNCSVGSGWSTSKQIPA